MLAGASALAAPPASAFEPGEIDGEPVQIDVTAISSVLYNIDNRNTRPSEVQSFTDDEWGLWFNRVNVQASWRWFSAGVRIDSTWFYTSPHPVDVALDLLELRREANPDAPYSPEDAQYFVRKLQEASSELHNRYVNWTYPSKYFVGFNHKNIELTVGDFYAQLGRGLVLSVRKQDELTSDTTIRGARATGRFDIDDVQMKITALAGSGNPLRIDEPSGRYLAVNDSVTPHVFVATEGGMPRTVAAGFEEDVPPTYAPDGIIGAQIEGGPKSFKAAVQGSTVLRQPALTQDFVRTADRIMTGTASLNLPNLWDHGSAYLEGGVQHLAASTAPERDQLGHALYATVSYLQKPLGLTFEGKHYRAFYPLSANTDIGQAREFVVQYSAPPTAEAFWVDTLYEQFNTCTTGARTKADVRVGPTHSIFAWVGHHYTWAESVNNTSCDVSRENENRVWDAATGFELKSSDSKSAYNATIGSRFDEADRLIPEADGTLTNAFYQEGYIRFDMLQTLAGPVSLQLVGWNRHRRQTFGGPGEPWFEGQNNIGLQWSPYGSAVFGVEYTTNEAFPPTYFNGQIVANIGEHATISVFAGQRRGAIRCVAGVCRFFPPFEGARVDATVRF